MPYISFQDTRDVDGFVGISLAIGWISEYKTFQIALNIGTYTIVLGFDFD